MKKIKYETHAGECCIFEVEDELVETCIQAELETAKLEFRKMNLNYKIENSMDTEGHLRTTIHDTDGGRFVRWTRL